MGAGSIPQSPGSIQVGRGAVSIRRALRVGRGQGRADPPPISMAGCTPLLFKGGSLSLTHFTLQRRESDASPVLCVRRGEDYPKPRPKHKPRLPLDYTHKGQSTDFSANKQQQKQTSANVTLGKRVKLEVFGGRAHWRGKSGDF